MGLGDGAGDGAGAGSKDLDLQNRDPRDINEHLKVGNDNEHTRII